MKSGNLKEQLAQVFDHILARRGTIFFSALFLVFGYVAWQAYQAISAEPDATDITAQAAASTSPHIDPATIEKIRQLQDNSVEVRSLFDQVRQNPFQE